MRVHKAGEKPDDGDDDDDDIDDEQPGESSGLVDIDGRVVLQISLCHEWRQMVGEAWAAAERLVHPSILDGLNTWEVGKVHLPASPCISLYLPVSPWG